MSPGLIILSVIVCYQQTAFNTAGASKWLSVSSLPNKLLIQIYIKLQVFRCEGESTDTEQLCMVGCHYFSSVAAHISVFFYKYTVMLAVYAQQKGPLSVWIDT